MSSNREGNADRSRGRVPTKRDISYDSPQIKKEKHQRNNSNERCNDHSQRTFYKQEPSIEEAQKSWSSFNDNSESGNAGKARDRGRRNRETNRGFNISPSKRNTYDNRSFDKDSQFRTETDHIMLYTNYFEMTSLVPDWTLYQYEITFDPPVLSKRLKSELIYSCSKFFNNSVAYDGTNAFSLYYLKDVIEHQTTNRLNNESITLMIRFMKVVSKNSKEINRINNIVFKAASRMCGFHELGKDCSLYDFNNKIQFRNNILIIPGYHGVFANYEDSCLLRLRISHKAINSKTILSSFEEMMMRNNLDKATIEAEFIGKQLITNYNKLVYQIESIDWETKPIDTFERGKDMSLITFIDFYKTMYGLVIKDLNQPMLNCKQLKRTFGTDQDNTQKTNLVKLIPEFCAISGDSLLAPFKKNILFSKEYNNQTNLDPTMRYKKIKNFISKIKENNKMLDTWKMDFPSEVVQVPAKLLKSVEILFANERLVQKTEWGSELRYGNFLKVVPMEEWFLVYSNVDRHKAQLFEDKFINISSKMSFKVNPSTKVEMKCSSKSLVYNMTHQVKQLAAVNRPQIIIFIIPKNNEIIMYKAIKRLCCIELAVPSQVITSRIIDPNNCGKVSSIITKIAAQVNVKLGGELWGVKFKGKKTMVVGMDTWRESKNRNSSVGAFVASLCDKNKSTNFTRWYSQAVVNDHSDKFYANLNIFMRNALKKYYEVNGYLPSTIICYRDGVTDDEHEAVITEEITQIKAAFNLSYSSDENQPSLIFIVVKKRVDARFYEKMENLHENFKNPIIGTVVDSKVIKDTDREFYLISQSVRQGTVNPAKYHILLNEREPNIKLIHIQTLTFMLTHMYYNWPGQIRVPAPCHYAYRLASLVGESMLNSDYRDHSCLQDKLFYI